MPPPLPPLDPALAEAARTSAAWPFEEASKLVQRLERTGKGEALFETGYGPSGLPHIGTFGEVARTSMVRHAFRVLTGDAIPTRLVAFSDDMDGLRKVPDNVPNKDLVAAAPRQAADRGARSVRHARELRRITTTRACAPSSTAFGFDYEFLSATECYRSGRFDEALLHRARALRRGHGDHAAVAARGAAADLFAVPADPSRAPGIVMQVPIERCGVEAGTIVWRDPDTGERFETPVTGGHAKLQWKPDWAMRWVALGVDYEMAGKDLIDSVKLSGEIAQGARRPAARGLQLRAVPRREGPEDLEVARATASPSTSGSPTARRRAWRCSCTPSRARPSGSTST